VLVARGKYTHRFAEVTDASRDGVGVDLFRDDNICKALRPLDDTEVEVIIRPTAVRGERRVRQQQPHADYGEVKPTRYHRTGLGAACVRDQRRPAGEGGERD